MEAYGVAYSAGGFCTDECSCEMYDCVDTVTGMWSAAGLLDVESGYAAAELASSYCCASAAWGTGVVCCSGEDAAYTGDTVCANDS